MEHPEHIEDTLCIGKLLHMAVAEIMFVSLLHLPGKMLPEDAVVNHIPPTEAAYHADSDRKGITEPATFECIEGTVRPDAPTNNAAPSMSDTSINNAAPWTRSAKMTSSAPSKSVASANNDTPKFTAAMTSNDIRTAHPAPSSEVRSPCRKRLLLLLKS